MTASSKKEPTRAQSADPSRSVVEEHSPEALAIELEWLLKVSRLLSDTGWAKPEARREQLSRVIAECVRHLGCMLGALIVPERNVRLVEGSPQLPQMQAERLVAELERPLLNRLRDATEPMLLNRARVGGSPTVRLLAVPVSTRGSQNTGMLLMVRSPEASRFTRSHLMLGIHLSRLSAATIDSDLDAPTGLFTRASLQMQLESASRLGQAAGGAFAIVCLKIDRLDAINKMRGFDAGDGVIAGVAGLLQALHRPPDALAARIAGNEFALVLPRTDPEQSQITAQTVQRLGETLLASVVDGAEPISLSCGIASFGSPAEFETGLALAQLACKTARKRGTGRVEVYQDTDVSMIQSHGDMFAVQQLREALRENRLTLFAQPIVPLRDGAGDGSYELLLRSCDDLAENRAPQHLLSAAHRNHLASAVDLWVIEHALAEAAPYRADLSKGNVSLAINISGPSLTDQKFLERTRWLIEQSRIGPERITFEITETVAVLSLAKAVAAIQELRALGCRFALDDFGTGVNSLKNLTSLPVDRVKIDGSFVADVLTNRQSESMVRAIVSLARDLGISTVAEYAESPQIIERLRELGVQYAQGYGIDRPRPFGDVLQEFRQGRCEPAAQDRSRE